MIAKVETGEFLKPDSTLYDADTIRTWKQTLEKFHKFDPNMEFEKITLDTHTEFINFCNKLKHRIGTVGRFIKDWKRFMNCTRQLGYHNNDIYLNPLFTKPHADVESRIALTEEEVQKLYDLDLSGNKTFEVIRDRYILCIWTGNRISDMLKLTIDDVRDEKIYGIHKKTSANVAVPLLWMVREIIKKYNGEFPKQYNAGMVNKYIKEIGREAGIDKKINYTETIGGEVVHRIGVPKYELLINHAGRATFITIMSKYFSPIQVMLMAGLKKFETYQRYIKLSADQNADDIRDHAIWQKPTHLINKLSVIAK